MTPTDQRRVSPTLSYCMATPADSVRVMLAERGEPDRVVLRERRA